VERDEEHHMEYTHLSQRLSSVLVLVTSLKIVDQIFEIEPKNDNVDRYDFVKET